VFGAGSMVVLDGAVEGLLRDEFVRVVSDNADEFTRGKGGDRARRDRGFELFAAGERSVVMVDGNTITVLEPSPLIRPEMIFPAC